MSDITQIESVLISGDLQQLTAEQRITYYQRLCESLGLNPLAQPFQYLKLSGRLVLYATKSCTEQLRRLHGVSITGVTSAQVGDVYIVTATAQDRNGRTDCATGAVAITGLSGDALANALMKAESKAKRRLTLSLCGLGILDETEIETIAGAVAYNGNGALPIPVHTQGVTEVQPETAQLTTTNGTPHTLGANADDLKNLVAWAISNYPEQYTSELDVKTAMRNSGVTTWGKNTDISHVKDLLGDYAGNEA